MTFLDDELADLIRRAEQAKPLRRILAAEASVAASLGQNHPGSFETMADAARSAWGHRD